MIKDITKRLTEANELLKKHYYEDSDIEDASDIIFQVIKELDSKNKYIIELYNCLFKILENISNLTTNDIQIKIGEIEEALSSMVSIDDIDKKFIVRYIDSINNYKENIIFSELLTKDTFVDYLKLKFDIK